MTTRSVRIKLKRVYEPAADDDGARLLVDRIWPRGLSKDRAALTAWLKDVAPSTELRHWFDHDPDRWEEFRRRYMAELRKNDDAVKAVLDFVAKGPVTLLYGAHEDRYNNAVALRDFLLAEGR
jgi:uncharacterized protein YeaO (DUF488 family)